MENNFDLCLRFEGKDDSIVCQQKPYSCTAAYYGTF